MSKTAFEISQEDQHAYSLPKEDQEFKAFVPPADLLRKESLRLPEISEIDLTRHFSKLAQKNMGIDTNFYPLGSCTMKLNPRVNELCANLQAFARTHPLAPDQFVQGNLEIIYQFLNFLMTLTGMRGGSLLPNAGAQGEFVSLRMIAEFHRKRGEDRSEMLIPDSAHGTNPATATLAGFVTRPVHSDEQGEIDLEDLKRLVSHKTAGLMLTNPNTLGLFSPKILEISRIVHEKGGLLFYDGANLNAIMNIARPGDMGFDVMHLNLHKTFSTPHGGGGPGSGPILCNEKLKEFLPMPRVEKDLEGNFKTVWRHESSIGQIASFHGNAAIYLRAYLYALLHGNYGLRKVAEQSVLNANYLKKRLQNVLKIPFEQYCMHEFVVEADRFLDQGIKALDIAKRLLDYGIHAPTIYFPLIVKECMLIEPTECESKHTLDRFVEVMENIVEEIEREPQLVKMAPHNMSVGRLDEVRAAKNPILKHTLQYTQRE